MGGLFKGIEIKLEIKIVLTVD